MSTKWSPMDATLARAQRRRDKIVAEIQRNRAGDRTVPTWVLTLILVLVVAGFAALVVFS